MGESGAWEVDRREDQVVRGTQWRAGMWKGRVAGRQARVRGGSREGKEWVSGLSLLAAAFPTTVGGKRVDRNLRRSSTNWILYV